MLKIVMLLLPAIMITVLVAFKLPRKGKTYFFSAPLILTTGLMAWIIGHHMSGVMGAYAGLACDLLLYPACVMIKAEHKRWCEKHNQPYCYSVKDLLKRREVLA